MYKELFWNNTGKIKTFAIITEQNSEQLDEHTKEITNKTFEEGLRYGNVYFKEFGESTEKTFLIFNCALDDARNFAKDYKKSSFFFGDLRNTDNTLIFYKSTNNGINYKPIASGLSIKYTDDLALFFNVLGFNIKFSLNDFINDIPVVINESEFTESLNEERIFKSRAMHRREAYKK